MMLLAFILLSPLLANASPAASFNVLVNQLTLDLPKNLDGLDAQWPPPTAIPILLLDIFSSAAIISPGGHIDVSLTDATLESLVYRNSDQDVKLVVRLGLGEITRIIEQLHSYDNFFGMAVVLNGNVVVNITQYLCM
jgi:hypothetical protein